MDRLRAFMSMVTRSPQSIFGFSAVLAVFVIVGTVVQCDVYRATSVVRVTENTPVTWSSSWSESPNADPYFRLYETQRKVMRKRSVLTIAAQNLASTRWADAFGPKRVDGLYRASEVRLLTDTELFEVACDNVDPMAAQQCATAIVTAYIEFVRVTASDASAAQHRMLSDNATLLRRSVKRAAMVFEEANDVVRQNARSSGTMAHHANLLDRLTTVRIEALAAAAAVDALSASLSGSDLVTVAMSLSSPTTMEASLIHWQESRQNTVRVSAQYGPKHPALSRAQQQLMADTRSVIRRLDEVVAGIEVSSQLVSVERDHLSAALNDQIGLMAADSNSVLTLSTAHAEVVKLRRLSDVVEEQMIVTSLNTVMPNLSVQIIDRAIVPTKTIGSSWWQRVAGVLVFGLLGGVLITLMLGWSEPRESTAAYRVD